MRYDAIVVGAGPAGSTAAYRLARAGASVLLLDRARFPRDKPCGGGLTLRAVRLLPFPIDAVVEGRIARLEVGLRHRRRFERTSSSLLALMTQRRRLDAYLVEQAVAAGADFREDTKVGDASMDDAFVSVEAGGTQYEASVLIGADGVNGVTARALGRPPADHGVALEGNVPYERLPSSRYRDRLILELGIVPGGYGWVFPKGDHANVGVGGWKEEAPTLRRHLERFCAAHGVALADVSDVRGYRLPLRSASSIPAVGRAALIGDAAGLVDPLTGDGIYEALGSAKLAAETALEVIAGRATSMDTYGSSVLAAFGRLHAASWKAKHALDRWPRLTYELVRTPMAWSAIDRLVRGDFTSPSEARGLARGPLKLLEVLGRLAPSSGAA